MRVVKRVITIIADSLLILFCCALIVSRFLPNTKDQNGLYGERVLTLKVEGPEEERVCLERTTRSV